MVDFLIFNHMMSHLAIRICKTVLVFIFYVCSILLDVWIQVLKRGQRVCMLLTDSVKLFF